MVLLLASVGCTASDPLDLGPALIGIALGSDTDVDALVHLRAGVTFALVADVSLVAFTESTVPLEGAAVEAWIGDSGARAIEVSPGVHVTHPFSVPSLVASEGDIAGVLAQTDDTALAVAASLPPVLKIELDTSAPHPVGEPWIVPLPKDWDLDYDYVLAQLVGLDGQVRWSNVPGGLQDWLDFLAKRPTPRQLEIPGNATGAAGALAVHFVRQLDDEALFVGPLNRSVSGLLAGTAWLVPLDVSAGGG